MGFGSTWGRRESQVNDDGIARRYVHSPFAASSIRALARCQRLRQASTLMSMVAATEAQSTIEDREVSIYFVLIEEVRRAYSWKCHIG